MGALSGVKVLELGQVVAAPFCGALLGDFGAEVIKVESINRRWPKKYGASA